MSLVTNEPPAVTEAVLYIDTSALYPVVGDTWHRARLTRVPEPDEQLTMLCGLSASAAFAHVSKRDAFRVPRQCWDCERIFRREHGFPPPPSPPTATHRREP
ncbi:hypothetical protein GCM10023192_73410 [Amycolatopsis samaneae]